MFQVEKLYSYPLKSGAPSNIDKLLGNSFGVSDDRIFAVIDPEENRVLTARELIDILDFRVFKNNGLIRAENITNGLYFEFSDQIIQKKMVSIWKRNVICGIFSDLVGEWLSRQLNKDVLLGYLPRTYDSSEGFLDTSPIHLINLASVRELSNLVGFSVDPLVFRPNITVDLGFPFVEKNLNCFYFGGRKFDVLETTERCIMVNLVAGKMNLESAKSVLRGVKASKAGLGSVDFGIYIKSNSDFEIYAGMECVLREKAKVRDL